MKRYVRFNIGLMTRIALILTFLSGVTTFAQSLPVSRKNLQKLTRMMAGEYDNNAQADSDKSYFHVILRIKPFKEDDRNGSWFYLEQAVASSQHLPFRQRICHLYLENDTTIACRLYELDDPERYTGAWKHDALLDSIDTGSMTDNTGCEVVIKRVGKHLYHGVTMGKDCPGIFRNALYATAELTVQPGGLTLWERGWNDLDQQIWGAEEGAYIFIKRKKLH